MICLKLKTPIFGRFGILTLKGFWAGGSATYFSVILMLTVSAQKMKFSIKDLFSKCDQIRSFLRIWSHLLKKSLTENFIFCAVCGKTAYFSMSVTLNS